MRAAVGQREVVPVQAEDADRAAAELDQPALALGGRLGQRQARLAHGRRRHRQCSGREH